MVSNERGLGLIIGHYYDYYGICLRYIFIYIFGAILLNK